MYAKRGGLVWNHDIHRPIGRVLRVRETDEGFEADIEWFDQDNINREEN